MTTQQEPVRPDTPLRGNEVETLLGFLDYQRATLAWKCAGLDDEQLSTKLPSSALSLGGLLKHMARVEDYWFSEVIGERGPQQPWSDMEWAAEWDSASQDAGDELRELWQSRVDVSRAIVAERLLGGDSALAAVYPAWGQEGEASMRWVLTHMIEEYARHNGHADLLREAIDGETGE